MRVSRPSFAFCPKGVYNHFAGEVLFSMVYYPKGVCSKRFDISLQNGIIQEVKITGGCDGNLKAICAFLKGRRPEEIIPLFKGIRCEKRPTSCPDQLAKALAEAVKEDFIRSLPPFVPPSVPRK